MIQDDAHLQPSAQSHRPAGVLQQSGLGVELGEHEHADEPAHPRGQEGMLIHKHTATLGQIIYLLSLLRNQIA